MLKSFKTEIKPTKEQIVKIEKSLGICSYIMSILERILDYIKMGSLLYQQMNLINM